MIVAERHFKKEIRFAAFTYLSEMKFKRNKKQTKTTVYLLGDLFGKLECSTDYYTFFIGMKIYIFKS